jgi:DNA-binding NtrC family response regulator
MADRSLIIMIDDDTDDQESFKMTVEDFEGALDCLFFPDCESAIAHFSDPDALPPGYVFIDLKLPRVDGDECLKQLQQLSQFDEPTLVIYSSSIPDDWRDKLSRMGVIKLYKKPIQYQS